MTSKPFSDDKIKDLIGTYLQTHWDSLSAHPRNADGERMTYADLLPEIIEAYEYKDHDADKAKADLGTYGEQGIFSAIQTITKEASANVSPADFGDPVKIANLLLNIRLKAVFTKAVTDSGPELQMISKSTLDTLLATLRGESYAVHDDYGHQLTIRNPRQLGHLAATIELLQDALHSPNLESLNLISTSVKLPPEFGHKRYSVTDAVKLLRRLGLSVDQ